MHELQSRFRISSDTGGTFTDLVVEDDRGEVRMFKSPTVSDDPAAGVLGAIALAAESHGVSVEAMLRRTDLLIHGTTHAINAIVTGKTARTAFLTTEGHPDVLTLREGGRADPFDHLTSFPAPYVPRHLTFEVPERMDWRGEVLRPLDEDRVIEIIAQLKAASIEAVAVCLLWSVSNPAHELSVRRLLSQHLPDVPVTLSHEVNPTIREYRRASSACIDASLKPLMSRYLGGLQTRLRAAGYGSRLMVVTSQGAMADASEVASAPIRAINSGPAMAPVAGAYFTRGLRGSSDVIVADTGGTTYDVSLVRAGEIPFTREAWIGKPYAGHMTGFPSVDVKSVGAGGGSIAWVDQGGVLHVGPQSAGASPGPACYGKQAKYATVSDAALALGYIDPDYFLGGAIVLSRAASLKVLADTVAQPLGCSVEDAAAAIIDVATENMAQAITDITVDQGFDPANAILVGGGGAAGLNSIYIARRLGCATLVIPELGAALSATGGLLSEIAAEYRKTCFLRSEDFDYPLAEAALAELRNRGQHFIGESRDEGACAGDKARPYLKYFVEARYPRQAWEIQVPLRRGEFSEAGLAELVTDFHQAHRRIYAVNDPRSSIEIIGFAVRASLGARSSPLGATRWPDTTSAVGERSIYLLGEGRVSASLHRADLMARNVAFHGPAIVESPFTSVVLDSASQFQVASDGNLIVRLRDRDESNLESVE